MHPKSLCMHYFFVDVLTHSTNNACFYAVRWHIYKKIAHTQAFRTHFRLTWSLKPATGTRNPKPETKIRNPKLKLLLFSLIGVAGDVNHVWQSWIVMDFTKIVHIHFESFEISKFGLHITSGRSKGCRPKKMSISCSFFFWKFWQNPYAGTPKEWYTLLQGILDPPLITSIILWNNYFNIRVGCVEGVEVLGCVLFWILTNCNAPNWYRIFFLLKCNNSSEILKFIIHMTKHVWGSHLGDLNISSYYIGPTAILNYDGPSSIKMVFNIF